MVFNVVQQPECPVIDLDIGHSLPCTATQQVSTLSAPKLTCMCPFLGVVPGQLGRRIPAEFALLQMEFKHSRSLKLNESPYASNRLLSNPLPHVSDCGNAMMLVSGAN